ncbi:hypothetical protein E4U55_004408 [Claviceps digitariae]|nr:hypothetical protein E4U55_004408 [Claviceps digitariae]
MVDVTGGRLAQVRGQTGTIVLSSFHDKVQSAAGCIMGLHDTASECRRRPAEASCSLSWAGHES